MTAARLQRVPVEALAALTLVAAWVTVFAGELLFMSVCEVDCGDGGGRGLFFLWVLLVPGAVLGVLRLWRGRLGEWGRMLARVSAVVYAFLALMLAWTVLPYPLWFFGAALPLFVVAAAAWRLGRAPAG